MKYLIVIVLALLNFALQAEDQPAAEKQVLAVNFSVSPEASDSRDAISLSSVEANIPAEVSTEKSYASVDTSYAGVPASSPAFIWIFGSLIAGVLALASGRFVKSQQ